MAVPDFQSMMLPLLEAIEIKRIDSDFFAEDE